MSPTKKRQKKSTSRSKGWKNLQELGKQLQNPTFKMVLGLLMVAFALFLGGSMISFYFHWEYDHSLSSGEFWHKLPQRDLEARNLLGKMGAYLGHVLVYRWFGLGAFILVWLLLVTGIRQAIKMRPIFRSRFWASGLFGAIWLPIFIAWIHPSGGVWSGGLGYFLEDWLIHLTGPVGSAVLLFFSAIIFLALRYRWTPDKLRSWSLKLYFWVQGEKERSQAPAPPQNPASPEASPGPDKAAEEESSESDDPAADPGSALQSQDSPEGQQSFEIEVSQPEEEPATPPRSESPASGDSEIDKPVEEEQETLSELEIQQAEEEEALSHKELNRKVKEFGEYDPKLDLSRFKLPTIDLLKDMGSSNIKVNQQELEDNKNRIVETLNNYNIEISKIKATIGPTVTLYEIVPAAGVRISKIKNLEDDIALSLAALGIRIIAPIPGRGTIGIEVPSTNPQVVPMRNLIAGEKFQQSDHELPIAMGKTISNETYITDLAKMPHLLMAGATGQGKSVGLNVILTSLLYKKHPSQVKFVLVDPKKVELTLFNKIERHYLAKLPDTEEAIITDTNKVINTLNSLCIEMDERYELLKSAMTRNIKEYNSKFIQRKLNPEEGHRYLPYIVLVIDEFADLIMTAGKEVETPIARLAQLARAIGIHLIVATQRPSVNVITGIIKANFPARMAFRVTSKVDSRTILDAGGAEQLIGKGDMLLSYGQDLIRLQCAFVDTPEVEEVTDYIGSQQAYPEAYQLPEYQGDDDGGGAGAIDASDRDALFEDAARLLVTHQQGSASLLQRKLKLGYNRAGRLIDQLEAAGIIGPFEGSKARQVLISDEHALEQLLENEKNN